MRIIPRNQTALALAATFLVAKALVTAAEPIAAPPEFQCGYPPYRFQQDELSATAARGDIKNPAKRRLPVVPASGDRFGPAGPRSLTADDLFLYEDSASLLLTDYTLEQIIDLMVGAANTLLATHGDNYDFIGFWLDFEPHHRIGGAFYMPFESEVLGIGIDPFNHRADYGLAGENIEGMVMLFNVNSYWWDVPGGPYADFTQLMICHELEHRWALFLPPLVDGRNLQGEANPYEGGPCGKLMHWSYRVDGQASAMEIREWVGANPALLNEAYWAYNADIPGGAFSYPDLYLMGYVSPQEMDAGASELRYMDETPVCNPFWYGPITTWSSADIIETAGPRIPDSQHSQWEWRTGWVMIHLPNQLPSQAEMEKAVTIIEAHQRTWQIGTLGRGAMDHALVHDATGLAGGSLPGFGDPQVALSSPEPNPLVTESCLRFSLTLPMNVRLTIHDVTGRRVATLVDGPRGAGSHRVAWKGGTDSGKPAVSGVYFARLSAGGVLKTAKLMVLR